MKNLLNISNLQSDDLLSILNYSKELNSSYDSCLRGKNIGLIFEKNSTRTRLSFKVGINQLDGKYIDIRLEELNLQRIESYEDTFEIMSCYLDCLIFRTTDHNRLELASKFFKKPIINALSDVSHPCQAISDIFTLNEHFGSSNIINIVWMGDINNVLFSLIEASLLVDNIKIDIFTDEKIYNNIKNTLPLSSKINFHFEVENNILKSSHCVMTDVFNSMNDLDDKEQILNKFQVNEKIMSMTNADTVFMHCLPAKIGSEVTQEVIKGNKSIVVKQAKNRMVAQRGILKWLDI